MAGPFAEHSIVLEIETGSPERFLRFEPDALAGDRWLHRGEEFDRSLDRDDMIDCYSLPDSPEYVVSIVTVPSGESLRIGSVAPKGNRSGGCDLVELLDRDSVPESWISETTTLEAILE